MTTEQKQAEIELYKLLSKDNKDYKLPYKNEDEYEDEDEGEGYLHFLLYPNEEVYVAICARSTPAFEYIIKVEDKLKLLKKMLATKKRLVPFDNRVHMVFAEATALKSRGKGRTTAPQSFGRVPTSVAANIASFVGDDVSQFRKSTKSKTKSTQNRAERSAAKRKSKKSPKVRVRKSCKLSKIT